MNGVHEDEDVINEMWVVGDKAMARGLAEPDYSTRTPHTLPCRHLTGRRRVGVFCRSGVEPCTAQAIVQSMCRLSGLSEQPRKIG